MTTTANSGATPARAAASFFRSHVAHVRLRPHPHRFSYVVASISIDVDRIDAAAGASPFFSINRFNLLSFYPADHGALGAKSLRAHAEELVRGAGLVEAPLRIELVCMPRVLGSMFNPLSVFYCWGAEGLAALIYEVRNTFGERHSYVIPISETREGRIPPHECDKLFYVSPFMDMALRYRFLAAVPGDTFNLKIIERDARGVVLTALLSARRIAPGSAPLLGLALRQLFGALKILGAIHFEALRLWLKGHRLRPRPAAPPAASYGEPGTYTQSTRPSP